MNQDFAFQESISADKKSIGFDYQFYYFIYLLINLKRGETIGYEVKDDVHLELVNGKNIFMQLKHSLQRKSKGDIVNLTERDIDLWKTIYNWINIIREIGESTEVYSVIKQSEFILVSNKSNSIQNKFITNVTNFKNGIINIEEFKEYIDTLIKSTNGKSEESIKLKKYMKYLYNNKNNLLELFLKKLSFDLNEDELIEKLQNRIEEQFVDRRRTKEVLYEIIGNLSIWKFDKVKKGEKIQITYDEVHRLISPCYEKARRRGLPDRNIEVELPRNIMGQPFVKELIDINEIEKDDKYQLIKFTTYKIKIRKLLEEWYQEGFITERDREKFKNTSINIWENIHRKSHRRSSREKKRGNLSEEQFEIISNESAIDCLDEIRDRLLKISGEELDTDLSNGQFYSLSDFEKIGWKLKWEEKYKK